MRLNKRSNGDSRARGDFPSGQTRAEAGGTEIVSEPDDAVREFFLRHEVPRLSGDEPKKCSRSPVRSYRDDRREDHRIGLVNQCHERP